MKSKGLLVSTIIMLVVVVTALSTATFAWFAVSADARMSNLTVQTAGSSGLQIAMIDTAGKYQSGNMTFDSATKNWSGASKEYGAALEFQSSLDSAYGVTGDGITMYTAASRQILGYETTAISAENWATAFGDPAVGTVEGLVTGSLAAKVMTTNIIIYIDAKGMNILTGDLKNAENKTIANVSPQGAIVPLDGTTADMVKTALTAKTYYVRSIAKGGSDPSFTYTETPNDFHMEPNQQALDEATKPLYLTAAKKNIDYFEMNFGLRAQNKASGDKKYVADADIFIKKLAVTASGGMAAASRIAIIPYTATAAPGTALTGTFDVAKAQYFSPFSKAQFGTEWTNDGTASVAYKSKKDGATMYTNKADANDTGFAYVDTTDGTLTGVVVYNNESALLTATGWGTATFFDIDKNTDWVGEKYQQYNDTTQTGTYNQVKSMQRIGSYNAANTYKYFKLVVWFEGEDAQCAQAYAGTGVSVELSFDYFQRETTMTSVIPATL